MPVKPSAFGTTITPAATTILTGETAGGVAGRFTAGALLNAVGPPQIIDVAGEYGVVADGTTDNATALMNMRTALAGSGKPHYELHFPAGQINYGNNRWLLNVRSASLHCYGTTFCNVTTASDSPLQFTFWAGDPFYNEQLTFTGDTSVAPVYLIDDAAIAAMSITCTTHAQAANFAAGNRLMIYSDNKMISADSYPPNARKFEWNEVVTVNSTTGVITLRYPIRHNYLNNVYDFVGDVGRSPCGKPRIVQLDRSNTIYSDFFEVRGAKWIANSVFPASSIAFLVAKHVRWVDCDFPAHYWWCSIGQRVEMINCRIGGHVEIDKLIDTLRMENSSFAQTFTGATGVTELYLRGNHFHTRLDLAPDLLDCRANYFHLAAPTATAGLVAPQTPGFGVGTVILEDNTITTDTRLSWLVNDGQTTLTIGSVSGTNILLDNTNTTNKDHMGCLRIGMELIKSDSLKAGRITSLENSGGNFVIKGTWPAPVASESWRYSTVLTARVKNNLQVGPGEAPPTRSARGATMGGADNDVATFRTNWRQFPYGSVGFAVPIFGKVVAIRAASTRAYTGPTAFTSLLIQDQPSFGFRLKLGLTSANQYARSGFESGFPPSGATQGYTLDPAALFWEGVYISVSDGGGATAAGTIDQMAIWWLEIDVQAMS